MHKNVKKCIFIHKMIVLFQFMYYSILVLGEENITKNRIKRKNNKRSIKKMTKQSVKPAVIEFVKENGPSTYTEIVKFILSTRGIKYNPKKTSWVLLHCILHRSKCLFGLYKITLFDGSYKVRQSLFNSTRQWQICCCRITTQTQQKEQQK